MYQVCVRLGRRTAVAMYGNLIDEVGDLVGSFFWLLSDASPVRAQMCTKCVLSYPGRYDGWATGIELFSRVACQTPPKENKKNTYFCYYTATGLYSSYDMLARYLQQNDYIAPPASLAAVVVYFWTSWLPLLLSVSSWICSSSMTLAGLLANKRRSSCSL